MRNAACRTKVEQAAGRGGVMVVRWCVGQRAGESRHVAKGG